MVYTKRFMLLLIVLLLPVMALAAQDATATPGQQPPATPDIPFGAPTNVNSQPSLPGGIGTPITLATLDAFPTAQPAVNITPNTTQVAPTPAPQATGVSLPLPSSSSDTCPQLVPQSFDATEGVCPTTGSGEICLGNSSADGISASQRLAGGDFKFSLPGHRVMFAAISQLRLRSIDTENGAWAVVVGQAVLNSTDASAAPQSASLVIMGDTVIGNDGSEVGAGGRVTTVLATSGINVRRSPDTTGVVVWQLSPGETITSTGRTADKQWIRIEIPSRFGGIGWVYAPYLDVEGDADTLPVVNAGSARPDLSPPEFGPMQAINLLTGVTAASCAGLPDSGILLQSPSGIPAEQAVKFRVNDVNINVNGTVFIQAPTTSVIVSVLEGTASVTSGGSTQSISTGSSLSVALNNQLVPQGAPTAATFDTAKLAGLPVKLLPREFGVPGGDAPQQPVDTPPTTDNNTTQPENTNTDTTTTVIESTPIPPTSAPVCTLTALDTPRNIRISPSVKSDVVGVLRPNETIQAVGAQPDADKLSYIWYETQRGFMRFDTVQASDGCSALTGIPSSTETSSTAPTTDTNTSVSPAIAVPTATQAGVTTATSNGSLDSTDFGQLCGAESKTFTFTFPAGGNAVSIGGQWTASAGTTATFKVSGGITFQTEVGDFLRLLGAGDAVFAQSGENRALTFTFEQPTTFSLQVIGATGDFAIVESICGA